MSIADKITYGYIKNIKRWMECPVCHDKMTFKKNTKAGMRRLWILIT